MSKFYILFFAATLTVVVMCFGGSGKAQSVSRDSQPKTKEEVEAALSNFSLSLVVESPSQAPFYYRQVTNDKGSFFESICERMESFDDNFNKIYIDYNKIDFVDFTANKAYELDAKTKTGKVNDFDAAEAGSYKGFDRVIAYHLFCHENYKDKLKKTGNETILGREVTTYIDSAALAYNIEQKFWIDDEYGLTLKYEEIQGDNKLTMCVTEFIVGGATVEGLIDLDAYKLNQEVENDSRTVAEPEIAEGVLSLAAMQKAVSDAGFNEADFRVSSGYQNHANQAIVDIGPIGGFNVFRQMDGSNWNVINVLEFETEELAAKFVEHITSEQAMVPLIAYRSGVFTVDISKNRAADLEAKLMEALKKAGWK